MSRIGVIGSCRQKDNAPRASLHVEDTLSYQLYPAHEERSMEVPVHRSLSPTRKHVNHDVNQGSERQVERHCKRGLNPLAYLYELYSRAAKVVDTVLYQL